MTLRFVNNVDHHLQRTPVICSAVDEQASYRMPTLEPCASLRKGHRIPPVLPIDLVPELHRTCIPRMRRQHPK
jgi:hypothetical protein